MLSAQKMRNFTFIFPKVNFCEIKMTIFQNIGPNFKNGKKKTIARHQNMKEIRADIEADARNGFLG